MRGQQGSLLSESGTKSNRAIHVYCMHACSVASAVSNSATLRTVARQAPLSMRFSRQEYWSGLPWPLPGESSDPGVEPASLMSPALAGGFLTTEPPGFPPNTIHIYALQRKCSLSKEIDPLYFIIFKIIDLLLENSLRISTTI